MTWALALKWALGHWRDLLIGAAVLVLVGACHARDNAIRDAQHAKDVAGAMRDTLKVRDSVNKVLAGELAVANAKLTTLATPIVRFVAKIDSIHDSIPVVAWVHDTVHVAGDSTPRLAVPIPVVNQADAALHECREYVLTCDQFKQLAYQRFANDSTEKVTLRAMVSVHPMDSGVRRCGITLTIGYGAVYDESKVRAGPAAIAGLGCRW